MNKNEVEAIWSGEYPCLCSGKWSLIINGIDVSNKIPEELRQSPMGTYNTYQGWYFKDWIERFYDYEDGLIAGEWVEKNLYWLETITKDPALQDEIFNAIQNEDWRYSSCGGCI